MDEFDIVNLEVSYGRYVSMRIRLPLRAVQMPQKWQDFNTVGFSVKFSGVEKIDFLIADDQIREMSTLTAEKLPNGSFRAKISGQIACELVFMAAFADDYQPAMLTHNEKDIVDNIH